MAAETDEYRDRIAQAVDRSIREGVFDRPLQGFYGERNRFSIGSRNWSQPPDADEQLKAIEAHLGRLKDRMEALDAARARIPSRITGLERSFATLNARLEAVEDVLAMVRRELRAFERAVMNVPGESE
jgi:uncharacterized protein YukE